MGYADDIAEQLERDSELRVGKIKTPIDTNALKMKTASMERGLRKAQRTIKSRKVIDAIFAKKL